MAHKCVHKGCGQRFTEPEESPCVYHPGPPVFHEGQKGWQCCKPRVLTFDEFLAIPPCTTGQHSAVDDTPAPPAKPEAPADLLAQLDAPAAAPPAPQPVPTATPKAPSPEPDTEDDDPALAVPTGTTCRRRGCGKNASADTAAGSRDAEQCVHHPGYPIFHEGSKGWTCCKRRVLEFDEFLRIEGCETKNRHLFVGSGKRKKEDANGAEKKLDTVRHDFYQTPSQIHATYFLKKIDKAAAHVSFPDETTLELDLPTADRTRYAARVALFGRINPAQCSFKIMGTKLDVTLAKADAASWAALHADDPRSGEIIQSGSAGRA